MPSPRPHLLRGPHKLVLAHADDDYRRAALRYLRGLGLDLTAGRSAAEAHYLARRLDPAVVILGTTLPDESGYLACAKLKAQHPDCRVILVGRNATAEEARFARFVGAQSLVDPQDGLPELACHVFGEAGPAAC